MFEGQRLQYVVPGYSGHIPHKVYEENVSLQENKPTGKIPGIFLSIFQDTLDMLKALNPKICTLTLSVRSPWVYHSKTTSRGKTSIQNTSMFQHSKMLTFLHHKCFKEQPLILLVFQINKYMLIQYIFLLCSAFKPRLKWCKSIHNYTIRIFQAKIGRIKKSAVWKL